MIKMGALAADRVNASTLVAGYVIAVVRNGDHLDTTRRKTGVLHATVTGKDIVPAGEFQRQARYVIHTDQGDTLPVPAIQTYPLISLPGALADLLCGCGNTVPAGDNRQCGRCGTDIPSEDADAATLYRAYTRAVELMASEDKPIPAPASDIRPRVDTFRGRKLRAQRGTAWGTVVGTVNGEHAGSTSNGQGADQLDRMAEQLRRDVAFADERRVTDPDAYPAAWYKGAPAALPTAVVLYLRHRAAEEAARRALECHDSAHLPGTMGHPLASQNCNGIPSDVAGIKATEIPERPQIGFDQVARELHTAIIRRMGADLVADMMTGESDPYLRGDVRRVSVMRTAVAGRAVDFVHYEGRTPLTDSLPYIAVLINGEVIDIEGAGAVNAMQPSAELTRYLAWIVSEEISKQIAEHRAATGADIIDDARRDLVEAVNAVLASDGAAVPAAEAPAVGMPAVEAVDQGAGEAPAVPTIDGVPAGMPYVVRMPKGWQGAAPVRIDSKEVARIIRKEFLPAWFPGVKFSVRTDHGSMYSGVNISWTDGPSDSAVRLVAEQWQGIHFDGMTDTNSYTGAVLYVNRAGEVTAYDLPGVSISRHHDVSQDAIDIARGFLAEIDPYTIARHSGYYSPYGQPWFGGSVEDCARWLATMGVDSDTRDIRGYGPKGDACPVDRCSLVNGHRWGWTGIHRDDFGRAFFATLPGDGDQGDGGNGGEPTTPGPDDAPAPAGEPFRTWDDVARHITGGRIPFAEAPAGGVVATIEAPATAVEFPEFTAAPDRKLFVINDGRGSIRVHDELCRDIPRELGAGGNGWHVTAPDLRGVVFDLYGGGEFEDFDADNWQDHAGDITVLPCAGDLPENASTPDTTPAPAGEPMPAAVRPEVGEVATVHNWQFRPFTLAVTDTHAVLWSSGETFRVPLDIVTGAEVLDAGEMRETASLVLAEPHPAEADETMPALAELQPWREGKPRVGQLVTALVLNDTAGRRREHAVLLARRVTALGCGCWRIECQRPGPVHRAPYEPRAWVNLLTGCASRHEAQCRVPMPTGEELAAAEQLGRQCYADGVPAERFPTSDERIAPTFKRLPVGTAVVYSELITAYYRGYEAAAEKAVREAEYAASISAQNAAAGAEIAERNPAAQECADINAAGAESAAANLDDRRERWASAREVARAALPGKYAAKFAAETVCAEPVRYVEPTDEIFAETFANCGKVPPAEMYPAIREAFTAEYADAITAVRALVAGDVEQDDDGKPDDDEYSSWPEFYTLDVTDYVPMGTLGKIVLTDDEPDEHGGLITIRHSHEEGTTLDGSARGDGVWEIVKRHGFTYRGTVGIFIMASRDKFADLVRIGEAARALREGGHRVAFDIDDVWRPAAVREDARAERVSARVERLSYRAGRKFGEAAQRRRAAQEISDLMPFGEPIKIGHHSEGKHRRAFEKIDRNYRASYAAYEYAEHLASRADGADANEQAKHGPRAIMRRVETLRAELRKWERALAEDAADGQVSASWRRSTRLRIERHREDIAFQLAKLGDMAASGEFVAWTKTDFVKGDWANVGGRWCEVTRSNAKSVTVKNRYGFGDPEHTDTAPWDKVHGRRRDGMQWDAPNAEAWPVADAVKVSRWETLVARARKAQPYAVDQMAEAANVRRALNLVLGLRRNAIDAERDAFGEPADQLGRRRRALAAWDVYERLTAGEMFEQIAATIEPLHDTEPRWVMPEGEPVEVRVTDLVVGDVVEGLYDVGFGGSRPMLTAAMVGPVTGAPAEHDRHESGMWAAIEVDGETHDVRSWRRVSAHLVGER